jgi:purine-binding chemotaxis protein CheW
MAENTAISYENSVHANEDETQYLTFQLAGEQYGVDILKVQEIRGTTAATVIPNAPSYVRGVINLRGSIVPIVDLRRRLDMPEAEYAEASVVVIMMVERNDQNQLVGLVVDGVSDVLNIAREDVRPVPRIGELEKEEYLAGIARLDDELVLILDTALLFSDSELEALKQ